MSVPCNCTPVDNDVTCCGQTLSIDGTTADLTISNGNTVNLCLSVKTCETQTTLSSFSLINTSLQIVYIGEDGVPQSKSVNLLPLLGGGGGGSGLSVQDTDSINLSLLSNVLTGNLRVDPSGNVVVTSSPAGVKFVAPIISPAITGNVTNTIALSVTGGNSITADLKYIDSGSIDFSDSVSGLTGVVKYSTDANNIALAGSDGGIFVPPLTITYSTDAGNASEPGSDNGIYTPDLCTQANLLSSVGAVTATTLFIGVDSGVCGLYGPNVYTFRNGLNSPVAGVAELGGTLLHNTTIDGTASYSLTSTSSVAGNAATFNVVNSGSGAGLVSNSIGNTAIFGISTNATGVYGQSSSNYGVQGVSTSGIAASFGIIPSSTFTQPLVMVLQRASSGTPANGIGATVEFEIQASDLNTHPTVQLRSLWSDVTVGTRTSRFEIWAVNSGSLNRKLALAGDGTLTLDTYGSGTHTGTPTRNLAVDASGNVIEVSPAGANRFGVVGEDAVAGEARAFSFGAFSGLALSGANGAIGLTVGNDATAIFASTNSISSAFPAIEAHGGAFGVKAETAKSTGIPLFALADYDSNANQFGLRITRSTVSNTANNALTTGITFQIQDSTVTLPEVARIMIVPTDTTHSSFSADFRIYNSNAGVMTSPSFIIKSAGTVNIATIQNFANNAAATGGGLVVGDIYRNGDVLQIVH